HHFAVLLDGLDKTPFRPLVKLALFVLRSVLENSGRHHGGERQRDKGGKQDGNGERHGEFAEQPADDIAHEEQRNQHGDQRNGERNDGEANLLGAAQGGPQSRLAGFNVADDVLDHHDGVVHYEAGGYGERHQGEIVEAVSQKIHDPERAHQGERHGGGG